MRLTILASVALAFLTYAACGDSGGGASFARACQVSCAKLIECDALPGSFTQAQCESTCTQEASQSSGSCTVSSARVDACADAYEQVTCQELTAGEYPDECDSYCENTNTTDTVGGDTTTTTATGAGDTTSGTACADLAACCAQFTNASQKAGCEAVASGGNQQICAQSQASYEVAGLCQ